MSLWLGHITVFMYEGKYTLIYDFDHDHNRLDENDDPTHPFGNDWKFLTFSDGITRSLEELVELSMASTALPAEYTSALSEHVATPATSSALVNAGLPGPNWVEGTDGSDRLYGGGGDDTVGCRSWQRHRSCWRWRRSDRVRSRDDYYNGGIGGTDTITLSRTSRRSYVDLKAGTAFGVESGTDVVLSFENATGGSGNDIIVGNDWNNG